MITRLDRYLLRELIGPFLFGIAAFSCILAGSTVLFYLVKDAIRYGIPFGQVLQLFAYKLPSIIVFTFPMATLLATILGFGRLSSDLEILALRAGGIGFYRLIAPVAVTGLLISILTIWFNEVIVPKASTSAETVVATYSHSQQPKIKENINFTEYDPQGFPLRIINVLKVEPHQLHHITIAEYDHGALSRMISANSGRWLPQGGWEFYDGIMNNFSPKNPFMMTVIQFKIERIDIPINPFDLTKREKTTQEMNALELREKISLQKKLGQDPIENLMSFHMKFSVPFASLIFSLLGATVGIRPMRSSSPLGLGISLVIILVYYVLLSIGMGLGMSHLLPAVLAAWLPNVLVGGITLYMLHRAGTL